LALYVATCEQLSAEQGVVAVFLLFSIGLDAPVHFTLPSLYTMMVTSAPQAPQSMVVAVSCQSGINFLSNEIKMTLNLTICQPIIQPGHA
jgi:hypothetical protein